MLGRYNIRRLGLLILLLASSSFALDIKNPRIFESKGRFLGWRQSRVVTIEEQWETNAGKIVYEVLPLDGIGTVFRSSKKPASISQGKKLAEDGQSTRERPSISFKVTLNQEQKKALDVALVEYDANDRRGPAKFPSVEASFAVALSDGSSNPMMLWSGKRSLHPYVGETTFEFEEPRLSDASISPDRRHVMICWIEGGHFEYLLLPLNRR